MVPMKMPQLEQVIRVARALPEDQRVPYAFEKRVMAHLHSRKSLDGWGLLSSAMWRAAVTCVAISLLTGALAQFKDDSANIELLAADLEQTVLAPIIPEETW